ncbi:MAG: hypothetical protein ACXADY_01300 [Candidatus Hodarchaeales archaeon]
MIIREFLCIHEYGTVIFHRKYQSQEDSTDIILRSGLISALYNFATETEKDSIDFLRMEKVQLFFKKHDLLLFVLFIDSSISPNLVKTCEENFDLLQKTFFKRFPEVQWQKEIIDIGKFEFFGNDADEILAALGKKLTLLQFLNDDGLLLEEDFLESEIGILGAKVGTKLLERNHDQLAHALAQNREYALMEVDKILTYLDAEHIERNDNKFIFQCERCYICDEIVSECFFNELLVTLFTPLNIDLKIIKNQNRFGGC